MKCPYCSTENRDDRESCYHCGKDISMLRLMVNKARHHYNVALEHAERQRYEQALAELEHAVELDHSFAPAHVVMGTVYAKLERFEEAERCWQTALSLDPHILKAHQYIEKGRTASQALPLIKRLRRATAVALALAAVFLALILWRLRPSPEKPLVREAIARLEQADLAGALDRIERLKATARSAEARQAARLLEASIAQKYDLAAMRMLALLIEKKPIEAHEIYRDLVANHRPPDRFRRQLESLDRKATEQAIAMLDRWYQEFQGGRMDYEGLAAKADELRKIFERETVASRVEDVLTSARATVVARTVASVPASAASTSETLRWLARLDRLMESAPEFRDSISSAAARLLQAAFDSTRKRFEAARASDDSAAIRALLGDLEQLKVYGKLEGADQLVEQALAELRRIETARLRNRLRKATITEIPQVASWIADYERVTSATLAGDPDLADLVRRTRRRLAAEMLRWCTLRDPRFEQRRISDEEARFTVERAEFTLRYVVGRTWRYVRDNMTFYAGVAWMQLGDMDRALEWFNRLEEDYPESPYMRFASRYREEILRARKKKAAKSH